MRGKTINIQVAKPGVVGYTGIMLYMSTSGFSHADWAGHFYPPGLPERERLVYYAREFNTCEVNSTYYAIPRPSNLKAMAEKTFVFVNNHWQARAINTIRQLRLMLD